LLPVLSMFFLAEAIFAPDKRNGVIRQGCITLLCATLTGGWWYARNLMLTGSLSGEQLEAAAGQNLLALGKEAFRMDWLRAANFTLRSHIWLGNWSFLGVRSWMYHIVNVFFFAAILAVAFWYLRSMWRRECGSAMFGLIVLELCMIAAVAYHCIVSSTVENFPGTFGHYLDGTLVSETVLLGVACRYAGSFRAVPLFVFALLGIDLFGMHAYYYAGRLSEGLGGLRAFQILACDGSCTQAISERLALQKGLLSVPGYVPISWMLYLLATLFILLAAARLRKCTVLEGKAKRVKLF